MNPHMRRLHAILSGGGLGACAFYLVARAATQFAAPLAAMNVLASLRDCV
jgi:fluoride ion exporter CrcB/FEX